MVDEVTRPGIDLSVARVESRENATEPAAATSPTRPTQSQILKQNLRVAKGDERSGRRQLQIGGEGRIIFLFCKRFGQNLFRSKENCKIVELGTALRVESGADERIAVSFCWAATADGGMWK